jgi:plastocyanin
MSRSVPFIPELIMRIARFTHTMFALTTACALAACGGGGGDTSEGGTTGAPAGGTAASAVDPAQAATITGLVHLTGTPAANEPIDMSEEPTCAQKHSERPTKETVIANNGMLKNAFVYVKEGLPAGNYPASNEPVVLDQNGCVYKPHVFGVKTGQEFTIKNSDGLSHNINARPSVNRTFNVSQPRNMESKKSFSQKEVMVPVRCDVHGWMEAYIGVLDHPYFAVTGDDGSFRITGLPPGTYTVEAWHEKLGTQTTTVTVAAQGTGEAHFTFNATATASVPLGKPLVLSHAGHAAPTGSAR